jgi:Sec23/Sec24 zinc finger
MKIDGQKNPTLPSASNLCHFQRLNITRLTEVVLLGHSVTFNLFLTIKFQFHLCIRLVIGNSTPRFLRPTIYAVPASAELQSLTHVPFGIHIVPLAQQAPEEAPIPTVDFGDPGPPRCSAAECRAYINPWCTWEGGSLRWVCNLCGMVNDGTLWVLQYLHARFDTL